MRVLGLGGLDHNGAVCVADEHGLRMLECERVTRVKHQPLDGREAFELTWERLGAQIPDQISVADQSWWRRRQELASHLTARFPGARVTTQHHHRAHLAAALYASPFERATVISIDGKGDGLSSCVGVGDRKAGVRILKATASRVSLGRLWWAASAFCGLGGYHAAGKLMGLAAYGRPEFVEGLEQRFAVADDARLLGNPEPGDPAQLRNVGRLVEALERWTGVPKASTFADVTERHHDVAASVQTLTERLVAHLVERAVAMTGIPDVAMSGGVALNGLANHLAAAVPQVARFYVPPMTDDRGLAFGAAAIALASAGRPLPLVAGGISPFLGPDPTLRSGPRPGFRLIASGEGAAGKASSLLADDLTMAIFGGRDEAGPRALGNRSVVASPRSVSRRDELNRAKGREWFRPFGCSALAESSDEWFGESFESPYMLRIARVRAGRASLIPSAVHVDGTTRLQTVTAESCPTLHGILSELDRLGHPPVLLNTSLNQSGKPLAHTVEDAWEAVEAMQLDAALIGDSLYLRGAG